MRIVFRVDVSLVSGFGHLSRCLTLARSLMDKNHEVIFISRQFISRSYDQITDNHFKSIILTKPSKLDIKNHESYKNWLGVSSQKDAEETIDICKNLGKIDWLIIDHYGINKDWHQLLREHVRNILVIDDLANRDLDCDLLLNQSYEFNPKAYDNLLPDSTRKLIGSDYVLMRKEFYYLREQAKFKRKEQKNINDIIIFFGTIGDKNLTLNALNAIDEIAWDKEPNIRLILGRDSPYMEELEYKLQSYRLSCELLSNVLNMESLLLEADIAIGAGGMNSWERCCLGLPTLITLSAENQKDNITSLQKSGSVRYWASSNDLKDHLTKMANDYSMVSEMSNNAFKVCDGNGTDRVTREMINAT